LEAVKRIVWAAWSNPEINLVLRTFFRLTIAAVLGGVIGWEREHTHRPAGLRTHVLVSVGAALVMCTSVYIFRNYGAAYGDKNLPDVSRMGAQVISGIGFLGAGTILREGFSVKGLTTAASLWTVSCVGLACGIGFWPGAIVGTLVIFFTLNALKKLPLHNPKDKAIYISAQDADVSGPVINMVQLSGGKLQHFEMLTDISQPTGLIKKNTTATIFKLTVFVQNNDVLRHLKEGLLRVEGVDEIFVQ
jgi:putative Mg2+ transporter-C (MgtC) family protein